MDFIDRIAEEMEKKAFTMCEKYCKYAEAVNKEAETAGPDEEDRPIFEETCCKCPMQEFFRW